MANSVTKYFKKLRQFSFNESLSILPYTILSVLLEKLPDQLTKSYAVYRKMDSYEINIEKHGNSNLVRNFSYGVDSKLMLKRDSSDPLVFEQIFMEKEYQIVIDLLKKYKINVTNVIDAGANIGCTTLFFKEHFPDAQIIAIEPNPNVFDRLKTNVELNRLTDIKLLQVGLWNATTSLIGDNDFRDKMEWSFRLKESPEPTDRSIEAFTIDSIMNEHNLSDVDVIKIDIEGGEDQVFKSSDDVAGWLPKVKLIAIEIHDEFYCRERIYEILKHYKYDVIESSKGLTIGINTNLI